MIKEPTKDYEFEEALKALGFEVVDHDIDDFSVVSIKGGSTHLEATDYSAALFEAWNMMKP